MAPLLDRRTLAGAAPVLFVLLWSTGFTGAKLGLPYAEPFTFLALRFAIVAALLAVLAALMRAPLPARAADYGHIAVSGLLIHGIYLGGVFAAIHHGISAGVAAVIVGTQPLLTAALAGPLLGERVRGVQWVGLTLGFTGVALVVSGNIEAAGTSVTGFVLSTAALLGITFGTLYQKRFCTTMDLRSGSCIQYVAAGVLVGVPAWLLEENAIVWSGEFVFALTWLILVLSVGAVTLLWMLIRRGAAARVASLFYLVPPVVAIQGYLLFDEQLGAVAIGGMALAAAGVAVVNRPAPAAVKGT